MYLVENLILTVEITPRGMRPEVIAEKLPPTSQDTWRNDHLSAPVARDNLVPEYTGQRGQRAERQTVLRLLIDP